MGKEGPLRASPKKPSGAEEGIKCGQNVLSAKTSQNFSLNTGPSHPTVFCVDNLPAGSLIDKALPELMGGQFDCWLSSPGTARLRGSAWINVKTREHLGNLVETQKEGLAGRQGNNSQPSLN